VRTRRPLAGAWALLTLLAASGCAVGRFIAGAPATPNDDPNQSLLVHRCSGCHATPNPAGMSGEAWQVSLERMKRRITLPASEWDSLAAMGRSH